MKLIYLISRVFLAWIFLNFLAHCEALAGFKSAQLIFFLLPFEKKILIAIFLAIQISIILNNDDV